MWTILRQSMFVNFKTYWSNLLFKEYTSRLTCVWPASCMSLLFPSFFFFLLSPIFSQSGGGEGGGQYNYVRVGVTHSEEYVERRGGVTYLRWPLYAPAHTHTHTLPLSLSLSLSLSHPFFRKGGRRKKNNELDNLQSSRTEFVRLFVFARKISHLLLGSALCVFSLCGELLKGLGGCCCCCCKGRDEEEPPGC